MLRSMILSAALAAALAAPSAAATKASGPQESFCATLTKGQADFVVDSRLRVAERTNAPGPFRFESRSGVPVVAIMCRRASALPLRDDWEVVEAGYPFFIQTMHSVTELQKAGDGYRLHLHKGQMTESERKQVNATLAELAKAARAARSRS